MTIGVGFIGAGWIVRQVYGPILASHREIGALLAFDPDRSRAESLRGHIPRIAVAESADTIFDSPEIDMVVVASPNRFHAAHALEGLSRGKHVLCEKPVCIQQSELAALERAVSEYPSRLFASVATRYRADVCLLRELIAEGTLGKPYRVKSRWLRGRGIPARSWYRDSLQSGGGVLMDLGPHLIDVVLWILDSPPVVDVRSVLTSSFDSATDRVACWHGSGELAQAKFPVEDNVSAFIRLSDLAWSLDLAWAGHSGEDTTEIEIFGDRGYAQLSSVFGFSSDTTRREGYVRWGADGRFETRKFLLEDRAAPYVQMLEHYIDIICNGGDAPGVSGVFRAMQVICDGYSGESAP